MITGLSDDAHVDKASGTGLIFDIHLMTAMFALDV